MVQSRACRQRAGFTFGFVWPTLVCKEPHFRFFLFHFAFVRSRQQHNRGLSKTLTEPIEATGSFSARWFNREKKSQSKHQSMHFSSDSGKFNAAEPLVHCTRLPYEGWAAVMQRWMQPCVCLDRCITALPVARVQEHKRRKPTSPINTHSGGLRLHNWVNSNRNWYQVELVIDATADLRIASTRIWQDFFHFREFPADCLMYVLTMTRRFRRWIINFFLPFAIRQNVCRHNFAYVR